MWDWFCKNRKKPDSKHQTKIDPVKKLELPNYICPVAKFNQRNDRTYARPIGNSVLVDATEGLFATAAHVIIDINLCVKIFDTFYPTYSELSWINWDADIGFLKLKEAQPKMPEAASFDTTPLPKNTSLQVIGFHSIDEHESLKYEERTVACFLRDNCSSWGATLKSAVEVSIIAQAMRQGKFVQLEERHKLYKGYLLAEMELNWNKDRLIKGLKPGLSGAPLITSEGKVAGILSGASTGIDTNGAAIFKGVDGGTLALGVPAHEVMSLLKKRSEKIGG